MNPPSRQGPKIKPIKLYVWTLVGLQVLLLIAIGTSFVNLGFFNTVIRLAIAVTSVLLLMVFFMHESRARALTIMTSALGFIWLALLVGLSLTDFLVRIPVPPPW
ncbi:MAG TPA: hypothetical protein VFL78_04845 [Rhodanobacteraceae bacterium]|nr:hypothetical protein [Rhodanobacteraceae bacterium]